MTTSKAGQRRAQSRRCGVSAFLALALMLSGCGDDGGGADDAYDYEGFWLMTSWTMDEGSGPQTIVRGGTPNGLLGDVVIDAISATELGQTVRFAGLQDGILLDEPQELYQTVTLEGEKWVIFIENDPMDPMDDAMAVFIGTREGDELTLTADPTDPRHDAGGPTEIVFERGEPWETSLVGAWVVAEIDTADPTACTDVGGGDYQTLNISMDINDSWLMDQTMVSETWSTLDCSGPSDAMNATEVLGYAEHEGSELRLWTLDPGSMGGGGYMVWDVTENGASRTLDRTGCLPASFCTDAPMQVVMAPAP